MAFSFSTYYQAWSKRLRLSWLGVKGQAIMSAFAQVIGDKTVDWGTQANLEHLPEYASGATPVNLIASERQLDAGPSETTAALATRSTGAAQAWKYAGTPYGMLIALYNAGYTNVVIMQQNGLAFNLVYPLTGTPSVDMAITVLNPNLSGPVAAPQHAIVITISTGGALGTMQFTYQVDGGTVSSPVTSSASAFWFQIPGTLTWVNFAAGTYVLNSTYSINATTGAITLGGGAIATVTQNSTPWWTFDANNAFCSRFSVLFPTPIPTSWTNVVNPPTDSTAPTLAEVNRIRSIVKKWQPQKATCISIIVQTSGRIWGWPVSQKWGAGTGNWGGTSVRFSL